MGNEFSQLKGDIERGTLTTVDLAGKQIGDTKAKVLSDAVAQNNTVTSVDLTRNKIGDVGIAALAETLSRNKSLAFLDLRDNLITDQGLKSLATVLEKNETLNLLNLAHNRFADVGTKAIANALKTNKNLTSLTISQNHIMTQGAKAIAAVLQQNNNTLIMLNLAGNKIGDIGAQAIAAALEQNHSLKTIDLSHNQIGASGAAALGTALTKNKWLSSLILADNSIGDDGAKGLAVGLEHNTTLTSLNIAEISFTDTGISAIAAALKSNRSLISLNVTRNKFNYKSVITVTAAVERSKLRMVNGGVETGTADSADEEAFKWMQQLEEVQRKNAGEKLDTPDMSGLIEEGGEVEEKPDENAAAVAESANPPPYEEERDRDMEDAILEAKIHDLTKKLASANISDDNNDAIIEMQQKLKDLVQQKSNNVKADKREAAELFASHPNLYRHYRVVNIRLEEIFLACKVAASEVVKTRKKGTFSSAATALVILEKLVSLLPFIGNSLQAVVGVISSQLNSIDNVRQTNKVKAISRLGLMSDLQRISEATARLLTVRYQDQIKAVLTAEEEKEAKKEESAASPVLSQLKSAASGGARELLNLPNSTMIDEIAGYAVTQFLLALMDGAIDAYNTDVTIEMQLINTLSFSTQSPLDSFKNSVVNLFGGNVVVVENGAQWQLQDFYRKPGIKTSNGKFFRGGHTDAKLHGYRLGTEDEALKLGLKAEVLGARKLMNSVLMSGEGVTRSVSQRELLTRTASMAEGLVRPSKSDSIIAKSDGELQRPSKHDAALARSSSEGVPRSGVGKPEDGLTRSVSEGLQRTTSKKKVGFADAVEIIETEDDEPSEPVGFRPLSKPLVVSEDARVNERKKQQMQKIGVGNGANDFVSLADRTVELKLDA